MWGSRISHGGVRLLLGDGVTDGAGSSSGNDGMCSSTCRLTTREGSRSSVDGVAGSMIEGAGDDNPSNLKLFTWDGSMSSKRFFASHSCLIKLAAVIVLETSPSAISMMVSSARGTTGSCRSCSCSQRLKSLLGCSGGSKPRARNAASRFAFEAISAEGTGTRPGSEGGGRKVVEIIFISALDFDRRNGCGLKVTE